MMSLIIFSKYTSSSLGIMLARLKWSKNFARNGRKTGNKTKKRVKTPMESLQNSVKRSALTLWFGRAGCQFSILFKPPRTGDRCFSQQKIHLTKMTFCVYWSWFGIILEQRECFPSNQCYFAQFGHILRQMWVTCVTAAGGNSIQLWAFTRTKKFNFLTLHH